MEEDEPVGTVEILAPNLRGGEREEMGERRDGGEGMGHLLALDGRTYGVSPLGKSPSCFTRPPHWTHWNESKSHTPAVSIHYVRKMKCLFIKK